MIVSHKTRSWLGSLYDYTPMDLLQLRAHECRYMAMGFSVDLVSSQRRVIFVIEYKNCHYQPSFNKRIVWAPRKGTLEDTLNTIKKEYIFEERGIMPRPVPYIIH